MMQITCIPAPAPQLGQSQKWALRVQLSEGFDSFILGRVTLEQGIQEALTLQAPLDEDDLPESFRFESTRLVATTVEELASIRHLCRALTTCFEQKQLDDWAWDPEGRVRP